MKIKITHFVFVGSGIIWMDNVNCLGYETSLTQCRQIGWGLTNCDPFHGEDAGVVCDNTTVEEISNNYCRRVNDGKCEDKKVQDISNFHNILIKTFRLVNLVHVYELKIIVNVHSLCLPGV